MSFTEVNALYEDVKHISEKDVIHIKSDGTDLYEPFKDEQDFLGLKGKIESCLLCYTSYITAMKQGYLDDCIKSGGCGTERIYFLRTMPSFSNVADDANFEHVEECIKKPENLIDIMEKKTILIKDVEGFMNPSVRYEKFNSSISEMRTLLNDEHILEEVNVDISCDLTCMHALATAIKSFNIGKAYAKAISEIEDINLDEQSNILNKAKSLMKSLIDDIEEFINWEQAKLDGKYNYKKYCGCAGYKIKTAYIKKSEKDFEGPITKETILDIVTKKIGDFLANKLKGNDNLLNDVLTNLDAKKNIDELIKELENNNDSLAESIKELRLRQIEGEIEANEDTILKNIFKVKKEVKTKTVYKDRVVEVERPSYGGCGYGGSYGGGCGTSTSYSGGCGYSSYRGGC